MSCGIAQPANVVLIHTFFTLALGRIQWSTMSNPQVALSHIFFGSIIPFRSVPGVDPFFEHLMHRISSSVKCGNSVARTFLSQFKGLKYLAVKGCF